MKSRLKQILVLQAISFALWILHSSYLNTEYAAEQHRRGVESGMFEYQNALQADGVKIPPALAMHVPFDKSLGISGDMSKLIHNVIIFFPACSTQILVLILLAVGIRNEKDSMGKRSIASANKAKHNET